MEFSADFFSLRFFGAGAWAGAPLGAPPALTDALWTPTAPTQGHMGQAFMHRGGGNTLPNKPDF